MTTDPAGLLQRIPELQPLCQESRILKAVESGNPFKVYRALWWAKFFNRIPEQREVLKSLLSQRRLFAQPIKKAPTLYTLNSVGTTLLGSSDKQPDGTYLATHFIVMLFAVPLLPLGAYVVAPGQKARSYSFFARVPLSPFHWGWSRFWALAVIAVVALGAIKAGYSAGHHDLHIVNAFDKPALVHLGAQTATVPAHGRLPVTLAVGHYKAKAEVAGAKTPLDEMDLDITSNNRLLIWNLAGAAPVFQETVLYRSDSVKPKEPKPTIYCGQRFLALANIDDEFTESPKEVEMSEGTSQVTRSHVDVAGSRGSASTIKSEICFGWLLSEDKVPQALAIQAANARASDWPAGPTATLLAMQSATDPAVAEKLALEAAAAHPDDLDVQRAAQTARVTAGHQSQVLAEYKQRAAKSPDSPVAQYLYVRLLDGPEALAATEQLLKRFPKDPPLLRLAVYERATAGQWADSDHAWQSLQAVKPEDANGELDLDALDLVALGRTRDAEARVEKVFPDVEKGTKAKQDLAELRTRLALLSGESAPDKLLKQTEGKDEPATLARARLGLPVEHGKDEPPLLQLVRTARSNPAEAIAASTKLDLLDVFDLDSTTWALTFAEAVRTRADKAEKALTRYVPSTSPATLDRIRRFVRGDAVTLPMGFVEPAVRAAAMFVRSRNSRLAAKERAELVAQARKLDWLHTSVSAAIDSWPQPIAAR